MPDDYYVSQYSGEEIDALLGIAGAGAVRYDAAQTLTDEQKAQARANIAAAPDGFGLGSIKPSKTYESTNGDNITATGWYVILPEIAGFDIGYSLIRQENYSPNYAVQTLYLFNDTTGFGKNIALRRVKESNTWHPWEWVNPPMQLGVEYRTTERYLGKPVYVKLINLGNLPNKTEVSIQDTSIGMISHIVDFIGEFTNSSGTSFLIPYGPNYAGSGKYSLSIPVVSQNTAGTGIEIRVCTTVDFSAFSATALVKYTKVSD